MKKIILFLFLLVSPISADSENKLLEAALYESSITPQQKLVINRYFQNVIVKKQKQIETLEEKLILSYGGKIQRDKIIKDFIKNEIAFLNQEIESYKIKINGSTE